jgi:hypothetical protein
MKKALKSLIFLEIIILFTSACGPVVYIAQNNESPQPVWASDYDNYQMVNYYYFPDCDMYYDVRNQQYVYQEGGIWYFSHQPPAVYASYDYNTGYIIAIDYHTKRPWIHNDTYITNYPPHYYRANSNFNNANNGSLRGYNENDRKPIYVRHAAPAVNDRRTENAEPNHPINNTHQNINNPPARQPNNIANPNTNGSNTNYNNNRRNATDNKNNNEGQRPAAPVRAQPAVNNNTQHNQPTKVNNQRSAPQKASNTSAKPKPAEKANTNDPKSGERR